MRISKAVEIIDRQRKENQVPSFPTNATMCSIIFFLFQDLKEEIFRLTQKLPSCPMNIEVQETASAVITFYAFGANRAL